MARDDDGRLHRQGAEPPHNWERLAIPDDARELDADFRALRRERRAEKRRARVNRVFFALGHSPKKAALPIIISILLFAVAFTGLAILIPQPRAPFDKSTPLATPVREIGQEGGLTPDIRLINNSTTQIKLRDIRPAVVMAVPPSCNCDNVIRSTIIADQQHHLRTLLVSSTPPGLPAQISANGVTTAADPTGQLTSTYHFAKQPGLLLVRADGIVNRALATMPSSSALNAELNGIRVR